MSARINSLVCVGMFLLSASICFAQENSVTYLHAVYRADGSILKGEITEWTSDHIRLKLLSGIEVNILSDEVVKVVSKNVKAQKPSVFQRPYQFKNSGIYNVTTLTSSVGPTFGLGITHAVGYRFHHWLGVGAGAGAESFDLGSGNQIIPLFGEARGFLLQQNITPYYAVRAGYGFSLDNTDRNVTDHSGGFLWGAEVGYRFGGVRAVNFFAGLGVRFQKATYVYAWPWEERITDRLTYRRTELKMGVIF